MKILIALQFWSGDLAHATKLAQFIAYFQKGRSEIADVLLVNRFDCHPVSQLALDALARKFNVFQYRTKMRLTGWPTGCNGMWISTIEWVRSMCYSGKAPRYKCVFTCEADGAPINQDWIQRLSSAWDRVNSVSPVVIAGPMVGIDGPGTPIATHINGNCLYSGRRWDLDWALKVVPTVHPAVGWDYAMREEFAKRGWANIDEIKSYYNSSSFTPLEYKKMLSDGLAWVHGDKSEILIKYGREHFGI